MSRKSKNSISDEDLLFKTKKNEFIERYTSDLIDTSDQNYCIWKEQVVPSCLLMKKGSTLNCIFCTKGFRSSAAIIRHYREQHFDYIPKDIFGVKIEFRCVPCKMNFNRKEHLSSHLFSDYHKRQEDRVTITFNKRKNPSMEFHKSAKYCKNESQSDSELEDEREKKEINDSKHSAVDEPKTPAASRTQEINNFNDTFPSIYLSPDESFERATTSKNSKQSFLTRTSTKINLDKILESDDDDEVQITETKINPSEASKEKKLKKTTSFNYNHVDDDAKKIKRLSDYMLFNLSFD